MPAKKKTTAAAAVAAREAALARETATLRQAQTDADLMRVTNEAQLRQRVADEEHRVMRDRSAREAALRQSMAERERQAQYEAREQELRNALQQHEETAATLQAQVAELQHALQQVCSERDAAQQRATVLSDELERAYVQLHEAEARGDAHAHAHDETHRTVWQHYDDLQQRFAALHAAHAALRATTSERDGDGGDGDDTQAKAAAGDSDAVHDDEATRDVSHDVEVIEAAQTSERDDKEQQQEAQVQQQQRDADAVAATTSSSAQATTTADAAVAAAAAVAPSADDETAALLQVLHAEVEQHKAALAELQRALDRKTRDEQKTSLLVGVLNTQLEATNAENARLHAAAQAHDADAAAAQARLAEEQQRAAALHAELRQLTGDAAVQQRQLQLEVDAHAAQVATLTAQLRELREAHATLQATHDDLQTRALQQQQEDLRTNAALREERDAHAHASAQLRSELEAHTNAAFDEKLCARAELDSYKTRLQTLQETHERATREAHETTTALRDELTALTRERDAAAAAHEAEVQRLRGELQMLQHAHAQLRDETTAQHVGTAREQQTLQQQLTDTTAALEAERATTAALRAHLHEKETAYTEQAVLLTAQAASATARAEDMAQQLATLHDAHAAQVQQLQQQLEQTRTATAHDVDELRRQLQRACERADAADAARQQMQIRVNEVTDELRTADAHAREALAAVQQGEQDARRELMLAKRTIEFLEAAMGDQAAAAQLSTLNSKLLRETEEQQRQLRSLHATIDELKAEQQVMTGGHTLQQLREEKAQLARRVQQLESAERQLQPLLQTLYDTADATAAQHTASEDGNENGDGNDGEDTTRLPRVVRDAVTQYRAGAARQPRPPRGRPTGDGAQTSASSRRGGRGVAASMTTATSPKDARGETLRPATMPPPSSSSSSSPTSSTSTRLPLLPTTPPPLQPSTMAGVPAAVMPAASSPNTQNVKQSSLQEHVLPSVVTVAVASPAMRRGVRRGSLIGSNCVVGGAEAAGDAHNNGYSQHAASLPHAAAEGRHDDDDNNNKQQHDTDDVTHTKLATESEEAAEQRRAEVRAVMPHKLSSNAFFAPRNRDVHAVDTHHGKDNNNKQQQQQQQRQLHNKEKKEEDEAHGSNGDAAAAAAAVVNAGTTHDAPHDKQSEVLQCE